MAPVTRAVRTGCGLAALLCFAWLMLLRPLPAGLGQPVAYLVQVVTVSAAIAVLLRLARSGEAGLRRARLLIAAALTFGAAAGVLATVLHVVTGQPPPVPSVADLVHLMWLPMIVGALLSYPVEDAQPGSRWRSVFDGLVAATALWVLTHTLLLEPAQVGHGVPLLTRVTVLAYPAGDVFVLGMLASVLPRVTARARRELVVTGSGLVLFVGADLAFSVLEARGRYRADGWTTLLAEIGLLLVLAGALGARHARVRPALSERKLRALRGAPHVPVALAVAMTLGLAAGGQGLRPGQLLAATVFVATVLVRNAVTSRDRDALTERLQSREELWRALVTGSSDLVTLHDGEGAVLYASPALGRSLGLDTATVLGESLHDWVHPEDVGDLQDAWRAVLSEPGTVAETTCRLRSASGEWRWMQTQVQNRLDDRGVRGVVVNSRDIHERHLLEQRMGYAAYHDALTGLGNRVRARQLLQAAYDDDPARDATVVLVDLDGFKAVNDTYGHARGDVLLVEVAARLRACVRTGDEVCRIGGDEFVLVLDGHGDHGAAQRVLAAVSAPLDVAGASLQVGASVGIATTADAPSPDDLLRNADLAMYASKEAGRNRSTEYESRMHAAAAFRMQLNRGLRGALDQDGLELRYQPIVQLPGGALVGAEALLRWDDPEHGPVSPDVFIPVAEESGIIAEIDLWVLDRACRDLAGWRARGLAVPRLSVNISRRQMVPELPHLVAAALARHGLRGEDLCIEVTESAVVLDAEAASAALTAVRRLGVHVALDDFGTGQSSLSQLARLPVDSVKIDRSFTSTAVSDPSARRLLTSIVRVCQALSLPVVAEGIEHAEVAELLAAVGCGRGQGWFFGRAEPAARFSERLPALVPGMRAPESSPVAT